MADTVVEQVYSRVYSKGIRLRVSTTPLPAATGVAITDAANLATWLAAFRNLGGVKSIGGPKLGRDDLDLTELDTNPPSLLGVETAEIFYNKTKAPGDKDLGPLSLTLNMTNGEFDWLYSAYTQDLTFGVAMSFPSGALGICLAFVDSLEPTIESSKLVEVACDLQPAFGFDYVSMCSGNTALRTFWQNYLPGAPCPATL